MLVLIHHLSGYLVRLRLGGSLPACGTHIACSTTERIYGRGRSRRFAFGHRRLPNCMNKTQVSVCTCAWNKLHNLLSSAASRTSIHLFLFLEDVA